jgi:hypothetical protein
VITLLAVIILMRQQMEIVKLNLDRDAPLAPTAGELRFQVALLAAVAAVAAGLFARFVFDAPLVAELMAHLIFAVSPIWAVEIAVGMLGPFAKHMAFLACVVAYAGMLMLAAIAYQRYAPSRITAMGRIVSALTFSFVLWAITLLIVIPILGGGLSGHYLQQGAAYTLLSLFAVHAVYGAALALAFEFYVGRAGSGGEKSVISRRRVIRGVGYAVLFVGIYDIGRSLFHSWLQSGSGRVRAGSGEFPNLDNLALEVTPSSDFYEVSKNPFDPEVDPARWRLEIAGLVETPLTLTYDDIKSLPSVEHYATLACISNPVGGELIGNALWRGVRLRDVLQKAGLKEGVADIVLRGRDEYADSIPPDRAMNEATLLVYEMNGSPLPSSHGFPVRLLVPGIYGKKNVKWISRIEAVDYDFKGYWQRRGWDDRAEYRTMSRIDAPAGSVRGSTTIAGIAFAGDRRVSRVEVSTDGGKSWEAAVVKEPLSPHSWVLWHKEWTPAGAGKYRVYVRAIDGTGITQTAEHAPPAPSGATGHHSVVINVES